MMHTQRMFKVGNRVRVKRMWARGLGDDGGETGTVVGLPSEGQSGVGLYPVLRDSGEIHGFAPDALELCSEEDGLQIAARVLQEKREGLFHDMVCTVAASRRINLRDPSARQQVEAEVGRMTADWSSADAAALRRKEFLERPELRTRFIKSVTKYLEAGELIRQLAELIDGDSSDAPVPVDAGPCR
jgi:hypothetical protein